LRNFARRASTILAAMAHRVEPSAALLVALLSLAIVISVIAQLLLYRLIHTGNLAHVTPVLAHGDRPCCHGSLDL
jgi:hypothetical protein